jgi:phenylalanine-4-hydroxylase
MKTSKTYKAKPVDANGQVTYDREENAVWHDLITRQTPLIATRACAEYIHGMELLNLPKDRIPQCYEISTVLMETTGWQLEPVSALISVDKFFGLLANKRFPAATFIRRREELDYLEEPDIFHEVFGHCPMLTNQACADFTHTYGKLALHAPHEDRMMLLRLYWFTIEFGLINTENGLRAYGGGILSSKNETIYCLESPIPQRKPFNILDIMRTPYRIDIMQAIYYVIDSFEVLYELTNLDLLDYAREARKLGMYEPIYEELE